MFERNVLIDKTNIRDDVSQVPQNDAKNELLDFPIWPSLKELRKNRSENLNPMKNIGPYDSCHDYVATLFHLLREELFSPLIDVTDEIRKAKSMYNFKEDFNAYRNVVVSRTRHPFRFLLTMTKSYPENPEHESRLTYGSLLCVTSDYFDKCFLFAEARRLHKQSRTDNSLVVLKVYVRDSCEEWEKLCETSNVQTILIESPTFYEGVKYTLSNLQNASSGQKLVLNKYIVDVKSEICPPPYLTTRTTRTLYDLKALAVKSDDESLIVPILNITEDQKNIVAEALALDSSQINAYYAGLTKQVALIQGPPGTGKTHVGLLIIRTLLENTRVWRENGCPILVLCYKNAALDKFLGGVVKFRNDVGRIGGKANGPLQKYWYSGKEVNRLAAAKLSVIGMTVTGATKYSCLLSALKPKILIVEEAAEVLECHLYAAICESVEHLILIGDHKQLRPLVTDEKLRTDYNFDISLFERLVQNQLPYYTLTTQHRMKSPLAALIRKGRFYHTYNDSANVHSFPQIPEFSKSLYFVNHSYPEKKGALKSMINSHEANFLTQLVRFMLTKQQGSCRLTVLAAYKAQKDLIIEQLNKNQIEVDEPLGSANIIVRVCTIDEFQGEESEVVLISFVRSNMKKSLGFLRTPNRLCVALSRAKYLMVAIGNFDMMASGSRLWKRLTKYLMKIDSIGPGLPIKLGEETVTVSTTEELLKLIPPKTSADAESGKLSAVFQTKLRL